MDLNWLFEEDNVNIALPKMAAALKKYQYIMSRLYNVDVSVDREFQKTYNGFYRVQKRTPDFYRSYFNFMERMKKDQVSFEEVLSHLYKELGRIEPSFSSKLVATIDDSKPVWDVYVLKNLGKKAPSSYSKDETVKQKRIDTTIQLYHKIEDWYSKTLCEPATKKAVKLFDCYYPNAKISNTKKIDLILWQTR